uniref:Calcineurin-like phosphoesterase domain containing 1 n=1 Tax=Rattus norvegicus TaxID=10116 RepID=A0A8I5ZR02_RAT
MSAAGAADVFHRARGRTLDAFSSEKEREWTGPFYFVQGADPQFGLMKAWSTGNCDNGGDEWGQEIRLTEQAVEAINKLNPKPKFFVLCGDLVHAMPGGKGREGGKRKGVSEEEREEEEVLGYPSSRCFWNSLPSRLPSFNILLSQPHDQV